jgi:hypothetical protein
VNNQGLKRNRHMHGFSARKVLASKFYLEPGSGLLKPGKVAYRRGWCAEIETETS